MMKKNKIADFYKELAKDNKLSERFHVFDFKIGLNDEQKQISLIEIIEQEKQNESERLR